MTDLNSSEMSSLCGSNSSRITSLRAANHSHTCTRSVRRTRREFTGGLVHYEQTVRMTLDLASHSHTCTKLYPRSVLCFSPLNTPGCRAAH
jgi:hypothetical protein